MSLENAEKGNWPHVINYLDFVHINHLLCHCCYVVHHNQRVDNITEVVSMGLLGLFCTKQIN